MRVLFSSFQARFMHKLARERRKKFGQQRWMELEGSTHPN